MDETNKTDVENTLPNECEPSNGQNENENETDAATNVSSPLQPPPPPPPLPSQPQEPTQSPSTVDDTDTNNKMQEQLASPNHESATVPETETYSNPNVQPNSESDTTKMECEPAEPVISAQEEPPDPGDAPFLLNEEPSKPSEEMSKANEELPIPSNEQPIPCEEPLNAIEEPAKPNDEPSNSSESILNQLNEPETSAPTTECEPMESTDTIEPIAPVERIAPIESTNTVDNKTVDDEETQNQSVVDDSVDDLLVPTDFVPDSADVIGDESKRKHSQSDEVSETYKKFKHDPLMESDDVSMHTESTEGDFDEVMCAESEEIRPEINEPVVKDAVTTNSPKMDNDEMKCDETMVNNELNITDILSKGISSDKSLSLADIIENADDLMTKDNETVNEVDSSDLMDEKKVSDDQSNTVDDVDNLSKDDNNAGEELNFDISEKLKEMGEISLAPVSKSERKTIPDFEGDEVSLEQICKKNTDGDDKRSKVTNLRKNIREVMDDNQLDASTLAAQREELERLARVQEQQRMIREMQRQVALDRQNSKTQNKVLSLLTGHTSLLKSSSTTVSSKMRVQSPGPMDSGSGETDDMLSNKSGQLTPSVSIAPIKSAQKDPSDLKATEPSDTDIDSDDKLDKSDDLLIVEEDSEEDEDDEDDDDVVELKPKSNVVTIVDSSDDDCIM